MTINKAREYTENAVEALMDILILPVSTPQDGLIHQVNNRLAQDTLIHQAIGRLAKAVGELINLAESAPPVMTQLKSGDRVLINIGDQNIGDQKEADDKLSNLREQFPGVHFTAIASAEVHIQHGEAAE